MKNLIYCCIFFDEKYLELLELLALSLKLYGNINDNTDILVMTDETLKNRVVKFFNKVEMEIDIICLKIDTIFQACYSRLCIFDYEKIDKYDKILYIDIDILITGDLNSILDIRMDDVLYASKEGTISRTTHGKGLFDFSKIDKTTSAFSAGVLLFNNCSTIKTLFLNILNHIYGYKNELPRGQDQSFIIYHSIINNLYNNEKLEGKIVNNPEIQDGQIISHFCRPMRSCSGKLKKMYDYMMYLLEKDTIINNELREVSISIMKNINIK